jgi:hypothetical protein
VEMFLSWTMLNARITRNKVNAVTRVASSVRKRPEKNSQNNLDIERLLMHTEQQITYIK